jgi:cytochrome c oxidase cbb3-type subunit 3
MSSGFRSALLAFVAVAFGVATIDRFYLDAPPSGAGVLMTSAHAQDNTEGRPVKKLSMAQGPIGPVPGPLRSAKAIVRNPYAHQPEALRTGRQLFVAYNCSGCHGGHAGGGMGPSLRDAAWIYGSKPAEIFNSIASGRANGMPAWGAYLPPESIWQLVTYIEALRTPEEPEPPQ